VAVADGLRQQGQVHVEKLHLAFVDERAEFGFGLVGRSKTDRVGTSQGAIQRWSGGSACHHANLEFVTFPVFGPGTFCQRKRYCFGCARRRESAEADSMMILNKWAASAADSFGSAIILHLRRRASPLGARRMSSASAP